MLGQYGKLVFIDLETTGATAATDFITEVGLIEVSEAGVTRWSSLVNPGVPIPPFIQKLTGITDDMVAEAPPFDAIAHALAERLRGALFIAHNARFDYGFLRTAFKRLDLPFRCDVLCTVKLSRKLFPEEARHNLDALVARHGLIPDGRHRALADADLLWQLWQKLEAALPAAALTEAMQHQLRRPRLPSHLEPEQLDAVPEAPGVYLFYGEHDVPLYIGRGAQLRQRVLSHFNAEQPTYKNQQLSRQVRRLDWQETAGEAGAMLLEAKLVRDMQPVHNVALRPQGELCAWQLREGAGGYLEAMLVYASDVDFGRAEHLYGLFNSRAKAEASLRALAQTHQLCLATLGLEQRSAPDAPCVAHGQHQCKGACIGAEAPEKQRMRLLSALAAIRVRPWPYAGPAGVVETGQDGREEMHVVSNWRLLGTARSEADIWRIMEDAPSQPAFDLDTYKILQRAMKLGKVRVVPVSTQRGRDAALEAI
jgi:DNA polymerase-3 subunit epsilon